MAGKTNYNMWDQKSNTKTSLNTLRDETNDTISGTALFVATEGKDYFVSEHINFILLMLISDFYIKLIWPWGDIV